MFWEYKNRAFRFADLSEVNTLMNQMGDEGWEAINFHYKVIEGEDLAKPFYFLVMFKRMKTIQLTGDID